MTGNRKVKPNFKYNCNVKKERYHGSIISYTFLSSTIGTSVKQIKKRKRGKIKKK